MREGPLQKIILWFFVTIVVFPILGPSFLFLRLIGRIKIIGAENLPKGGSAIFAFNHPSMIETVWVPLIALFHCFPKSLITPLRYAAWSLPDAVIARKLFFLKYLRCISVETIQNQRKDLGALNKAAAVVKNGGWLSIALEGGRTGKGREFLSTAEGAKIRKPLNGIGRIVQGCGSKVIPIWVETPEDIAPLRTISWLFWVNKKIIFVVGKPLDFSIVSSALPDNRGTWKRISLIIAQEILGLSGKVPR